MGMGRARSSELCTLQIHYCFQDFPFLYIYI
uniref:Uncharacterized protein n=1 Tax=Rhizophora mucronata TaxID=61149 RepID=A0A2P2IMR2_RHIMU